MYNIFAVSDATGKTAEGVVRAALTQFDESKVVVTRRGGIRTTEQIHKVVQDAAVSKGFIVHTMVSEALRRDMFSAGREANVATIDLMGSLLVQLTDLLSIQPRSEPGLFQTFDDSYVQRIDAINFAVRHDDGANVDDLDKAEIVLVGVSRTSKTPLSIYLSYRGWRVANVPIVLGLEPPEQLFSLPRRRVVGLIVRPERLSALRKARMEQLGTHNLGYADMEHVRQEVAYAYHVFERRRDWPLVDVTTKPIEETASEIVALLGQKEKQE